MALDDLKDRLREQGTALLARIQESSVYNELNEKFLDLNPNAQKAALALSGVIFALFLFLFPWIFFSSSQDQMAAFEDKKQMLRELFRTSRTAASLPPTPGVISPSELRMAISGVLSTEKPPVLQEQQLSISDFDNEKISSSALPKGLTQKGVIVMLSKLTVDQIVKVGGRLQSLRPTAKLVGVKAQASAQDPHYFDVSFKVVGFNLPQPAVPAAKGAKPGAKASESAGAKKEE